VVLGACGAVIGAFGGLAARTKAISLIGPINAGLTEDVIAIVAAVAIVMFAGRG
jgi:uncharacterized membrane protein